MVNKKMRSTTLRIHSMKQILKNSKPTKLNVLTSSLPIGKGKQEIYLKRNSVSGLGRDSSHPDVAEPSLISIFNSRVPKSIF